MTCIQLDTRIKARSWDIGALGTELGFYKKRPDRMLITLSMLLYSDDLHVVWTSLAALSMKTLDMRYVTLYLFPFWIFSSKLYSTQNIHKVCILYVYVLYPASWLLVHIKYLDVQIICWVSKSPNNAASLWWLKIHSNQYIWFLRSKSWSSHKTCLCPWSGATNFDLRIGSNLQRL